MKKNKKVLIVSFSEISTDPRVLRQIELLKPLYSVAVIGYGDFVSENVTFFKIDKNHSSLKRKVKKLAHLVLRNFDAAYWSDERKKSAAGYVLEFKADLVIANDIDALPVSVKATSAPVILDAHEYSPLEFENRYLWKKFVSPYYDYLCNRYLKRTSARFTVCRSIAELYERNFSLPFKVMMNSPSFLEAQPRLPNKEHIRIVHHGASIRDRKIEDMIYLMDFLPKNYELNLILMNTDDKYLEFLKEISKDRRVNFLAPVPTLEISKFISQFDIGLFLLPPVNMNYKYALPNKFFEFVQARLCIAIGPSAEMLKLLREHRLGVYSETFDLKDISTEISKLTVEDIYEFKKNANLAAEKLSFESQSEDFLTSISLNID